MGGYHSKSYSSKSKPLRHNPNWMSKIDDKVLFKHLTIPGTHDSGAQHWLTWACTQSWSIRDQLLAGIRYFDIRLMAVKDVLILYHGPISLDKKFSDVMSTFNQFLQEHPSEFIFFYTKRENREKDSTKETKVLFEEEISKYKERMHRYNNDKLPTTSLGELRGKIVYMDCFDRKMESFSNWNEQNEYNVKTIFKINIKKDAINNHLRKAINGINDECIYSHMLSGSSEIGMTTAAYVAWNTNDIPFNYKGRMGIVAADYPGEDLIEYLIQQNFEKPK